MEKSGKEIATQFLLAFIVALFIWGYVTNMQNPVQTKNLPNVPVSVINKGFVDAQNLVIEDCSNLTTNVVVEGRYSDIQNVSNSDVSAVLDLDELALKEGSNNISLEIKSNSPYISIVKEKTPLQIKVEVVKAVSREIPVTINVAGSLPDGYIAGEPVLSKTSVVCTGIMNDLENVKFASGVVRLSNSVEDINATVKIEPINKIGEVSKNVSLKDSEIDIEIPIYMYKDVPVELDIANSLPKGKVLSSYTFDRPTITIYGKKDNLDKISSIKTKPLDLSRRYYDFEKRMYLDLPEGIFIKGNIESVYCSFIVQNR